MNEIPQPSHDSDADVDAHLDQYLTFLLAGEEYGVDILKVQEIKGWTQTTHIPNTPDYIRGAINMRGTIVPVVDLRLRFGLPSIEYGLTTVVIVLNGDDGNNERTVGIIVDAVSEVYNFSSQQLQAPPDSGAKISQEFVTALASVEDKMIILLDIDNLVINGVLKHEEQRSVFKHGA